MKKWIPIFVIVAMLGLLFGSPGDTRYYPIPQLDVGTLRVDEIEHTDADTEAWGIRIPDSDITIHESPQMVGSIAYNLVEMIADTGKGTIVLAPVTHLVSNGPSLQHSSTTVTFDGATNKIIDTTNGDFGNDNFNSNLHIKVGGSSQSANNNVFKIVSRTTTEIVVDGPITTDATPGETITLDWAIPEEVTVVFPQGATLSVDTRTIYFETQPVAGRYQIFTGSGTVALVNPTYTNQDWWNDSSGHEASDLRVLSAQILSDDDDDTKIQVEESPDEDLIRFDVNGTEREQLSSTGFSILKRGGMWGLVGPSASNEGTRIRSTTVAITNGGVANSIDVDAGSGGSGYFANGLTFSDVTDLTKGSSEDSVQLDATGYKLSIMSAKWPELLRAVLGCGMSFNKSETALLVRCTKAGGQLDMYFTKAPDYDDASPITGGAGADLTAIVDEAGGLGTIYLWVLYATDDS